MNRKPRERSARHQPHTADCAAAALHALDPGLPYDDWLPIVVAAFGAGLLLEVVRAWCESGRGWKPGETPAQLAWAERRARDSRDDGAGLFRRAGTAGWTCRCNPPGRPRMAENARLAPAPTQKSKKSFPPQKGPSRTDTAALSRHLWESGQPMPVGGQHCPHRYLTTVRNLWRPEVPAPDCLRWLPWDNDRPAWAGESVGCLLALYAPLHAWTDAWPELPTPAGVQRIPVAADGRGVGEKRSLGPSAGCLVVVGNPQTAPIRVAEGVADALALAARLPGPALAVLGTGGYRGEAAAAIAAWAKAGNREVVIYADLDDNRAGDKAGDLRKTINQAGGKAQAVYPPSGATDPADQATRLPFPPLPDGWRGMAQDLQERHAWPWWECCRAASLRRQCRGCRQDLPTNSDGLCIGCRMAAAISLTLAG